MTTSASPEHKGLVYDVRVFRFSRGRRRELEV
jgi:hypothetical protein